MKYFKLQTLGVLSLFILLGALMSITPNRTVAVHDAELRYIETSNNMSLRGGVMPASCESYAGQAPENLPQHFFDDTNGHCSGTCPAPMYDELMPYRKCGYADGISYVIPVSSSCPALAPWNDAAGNVEDNPAYPVRVCKIPNPKTCLEFTAGCTCTNGALNTSYTDGEGGCDVCPTGLVYNVTNKTCETCGYDGCTGNPPRCTNGSLNAPTCVAGCRSNQEWISDGTNSRCEFTTPPCYGNTCYIEP